MRRANKTEVDRAVIEVLYEKNLPLEDEEIFRIVRAKLKRAGVEDVMIYCDRCRIEVNENDAVTHKVLTNHDLYVIDFILGSRRKMR